ncbi:unnamed protein product [Taenia asiatica]|uniref:Nuclear pore complex protein n=1 Tax=Taenia asiatica TaxID=60517 RepID=A0A0R3VV33_TAEAS|nr:unnamed protein product [Taenia asiatica]
MHAEESANDTTLMRQPMRYTTIQNYAQSDVTKVAKVLLKPSKSSDLSECNQEHASNRTIQAQISNSGKALQRSLQLLNALEKAAQCLEETPNTPVVKEEIILMVRYLKINIANLLHYHSEKDIVNNLYKTDDDLRETQAQRLCLQRGDITRAVAMEGWRPFHSSYLSKGGVQPKKHVEGNANRVLSKCVAWWNSENPALSPYERAMFAAQSGNLSALLRAMTSGNWEDLLWAHCRALVESRVDATLRTKIDCGPRADTLSVLGRTQKDFEIEDIGLQLPNSAWLPGSWTLSEAFSKAETALGWCPMNCLFRVFGADSSFAPPILCPSEISAFLNRNEINDIKTLGGSNSPPIRHMLLQAMFYAI